MTDPAVTAGRTTVTVAPETARLTVSQGDETVLDCGLGPLDGAADATVTARADGVRVATADATVALTRADGAVDVDVRAPNAETDDLLRADTDAFGPDARIYWHGYQSWTPTATLSTGERFERAPPERRPQNRDLRAPDDTSHGVVGLVPADGPTDAVTLGVLDHSRALSRFDIAHDADGIGGLTAVCAGASDGGAASFPTLRVDATNALRDALAGVANAVGERMDARVPASTPTGWCSWYHYFTDVTEAAVRENATEIDDWGVGLDVVQLDDGYQRAFGDWTTLADGFEDVEALFADVDDAGHTPGLWVAPFYVEADSTLAREHPEWLVTEDGDPVSAAPRHGPMYGLDTTHPGVERWIANVFETIADWGAEYLKLDFLYAAALPGERADGDATRVEAYRNGLATIRDAIGEDVTVLGCGALQFPSVGLVDAMRVGPDTAPYWRAEVPSEPAHENAVRNVLNRQWTHGRLWGADPDCQLVREATDLSTPERRSFATLIALLGGTNVVSDRIADVGPPGRSLVEQTLPPVDAGRVLGIGERDLPTTVVGAPRESGARAVAAFNWGDEPERVRVTPDEHGLSGGHCWDVWSGAYAGTGPLEREVPAHGCLLAHVAPARNRPQLLASDHLANLPGLVGADSWSAPTLTVAYAAERARDAITVTPSGETRAVRLEPGTNTYEIHQ